MDIKGRQVVKLQMKILFFSDSFGHTTFIENQVEQVSTNHDTYYVCTQNFAPECSFTNIIEIRFRYSLLIQKLRDRLEMHQLYLTFKNREFRKKLSSKVQLISPDVIHLQFGYEAIRFLDNYYDSSIPTIIHFRGYDASRLLKNSAYVSKIKRLLKLKNIYPVFVCKYLIRNFESTNIGFKNSPRVIYSNTNTDFFKRTNYSTDTSKFILLQLSSFREKKGHFFTLNALRRYIDQTGDTQIQLIFTGAKDGPQYESIVHLVEELCLNNFVKFEGIVTPKRAKVLMEKSHCAILHSVTTGDGDQEGIPNALMEAMSMELPVISSCHSGIPELLTNEAMAWMVAERDIAGYCEAIKKMKKGWRWASENREIVISNFSRPQFEKKTMAMYQEITS